MYGNDVPFETLKGKTLASVVLSEEKDRIDWKTTDGEHFCMAHSQDCCESVSVEDICGDLSDLVGSPVVGAEVVTHDADNPWRSDSKQHDESYKWTFYKITTYGGGVTIRWYGSSNGYYGVEVDFTRVT